MCIARRFQPHYFHSLPASCAKTPGWGYPIPGGNFYLRDCREGDTCFVTELEIRCVGLRGGATIANVKKIHCTNRAEWQLQPGKPADRLSSHYRLDCDFGTPVIAIWGNEESEPIYLCPEHAREFRHPSNVGTNAHSVAGQLAGNKRETSAEAGEVAVLKRALYPPINQKIGEVPARPLPEARPYISNIFRGTAAGFLIAALVTTSGFLFHAHRREMGEILIRWGVKLEGTPTASASQPPEGSGTALVPSPPGPAPVERAEIAPAAVQVAASRSSSANLPAYASTAPIAQKQAAARPTRDDLTRNGPRRDSGEADLSAGPRSWDGNSNALGSPAAAPLLWTAVAKGDLAAESKLARLYLRGDGVAKSCEQARVLLRAASAKGNTEAKHLLVNMEKNGDTNC